MPVATQSPDETPPDGQSLIDTAVANHRRRSDATTQGQAPRVYRASGTTPPTTAKPEAPLASPSLLLFGVIHPALVIVVEAATGMCAKQFFDPMPTVWHGALIAAVPAGNLVLWLHLNGGLALSPRRLALINGFATGIAAFYALLFLPLLPIAIVGLLIGLGVLPLGPLTSFVASLRLTSRLGVSPRRLDRRSYGAGLIAGIVALVALDTPQAITRHGLQLAASTDADQRTRGLALLRSWGSRDLLLDIANGRSMRPAGPISILMSFGEIGPFRSAMPPVGWQQAREIYYRVTGEAFTTAAAQPNPRQATLFAGTWDSDLGGTQVGGVVPHLSLASSRIDGSINADDALAYIEWLFEVRNDGPAMSEARLSIALPPGAVVSRVTLWVNGIEEEAAFAGRAQVRAAYERVVRRSRDPFLVTTNGADRILAQAFPVMPNGGIMKFKIGITAPLELDSLDKGRLVLPAITDRNFAVGTEVRHSIWLESKRDLTVADRGLSVVPLSPAGTRVTGEIGDRGLAAARSVIHVSRDATRTRSSAVNSETGSAVQEIVAGAAPSVRSLMLVVDGSAATKPHVRAILAGLDSLPDGLRVGLVIAADQPTTIAAAPWTPEHRARLREVLLKESFIGGADNTEGLIKAVLASPGGDDARLLWLHGPQPVRFAATRARFEQVKDRVRSMPALSLYALAPGPNMMLNDAPWAGHAADIPATGDITSDLKRALRRMTGQDPVPLIRRTLVEGPDLMSEPQLPQPIAATATGSSHIVRLAAHDAIMATLRKTDAAVQTNAVALAGLHRLVTPVSGAVVLESKRQYQEAGLVQGTKGEPGKVPTVPEPHEWMLILLAVAGLGWLLKDQLRLQAARTL